MSFKEVLVTELLALMCFILGWRKIKNYRKFRTLKRSSKTSILSGPLLQVSRHTQELSAFCREMESFCGPCNWVPANFLRINIFFFHVNILSHLGYDLVIYKKYWFSAFLSSIQFIACGVSFLPSENPSFCKNTFQVNQNYLSHN